MATIIKAYKVDSCDLNAVESALEAIRKKVDLKAKRLYAELLANEIELLVDDISLNVLKRPEIPIYDCCVNELNNKISWATGNNSVTVYNFGVQAAIFLYKGATYIKLNVINERLAKEIKSIPDVSEFNLSDDNDKASESKARVWDEIKNIYSNGYNPMVRQLYPTGGIEVEWKNVSKHFHKPSDRLDLRVRYTITSELLNQLGMQKEIPNFRLLPYLDEAMTMLELPSIQAEAEARKSRALNTIVNITEAMVKADPKSEAPKTFIEDEPEEIVQ